MHFDFKSPTHDLTFKFESELQPFVTAKEI